MVTMGSKHLILFFLLTFVTASAVEMHRIPLTTSTPTNENAVLENSSNHTTASSNHSNDREFVGLTSSAPRSRMVKIETVGTDRPHIFVGNMKIQGQKQPFRMMFDTTATDLFVLGKHLSFEDTPEGFEVNNRNFYDHEPKLDAKPFNKRYDDGSMYHGEIATGGISLGGVSLNQVNYGVVDSINKPAVIRRGNVYEGVIGLNIGQDNPMAGVFSDTTPLFQEMVQSELLTRPTVSLYFNPKSRKNGEIIFGGIDCSLFEPGQEMHFFPTVGAPRGEWGAWAFTVDELNLGELEGKKSKKNGGGVAVVKGGFVAEIQSTLEYGIYAPNKSFSKKLRKLIKGSQRYDRKTIIPCNQRSTLPPLNFVIGGHVYGFSGEEYFPFPIKKWNDEIDGGYCELFVSDSKQKKDQKNAAYGLGVPFLMKYYTALVAETPAGGTGGGDTTRRIGLALAAKTVDKQARRKQRKRDEMMEWMEDAMTFPSCGIDLEWCCSEGAF